MGGPSGQQSGPGGGLGPPIDAPDPLQKYRWWIIGGFVIALAGGAYYVTTRQKAAFAGAGATGEVEYEPEPARSRITSSIPRPTPTAPVQTQRVSSATATAVAPARPSMLLEALKEELFQLEVEHKQGKITQEEYEKAKAALDGTLERAIKRESQKV
jgi:hypothetical protein